MALAMKFQTDETVAPIVAATYREAGIPMIAIVFHILVRITSANPMKRLEIGDVIADAGKGSLGRFRVGQIILPAILPPRRQSSQMRLTECVAVLTSFFPPQRTADITHPDMVMGI